MAIVNDGNDLIGRMQLLFDLIPLALQTDSTSPLHVVNAGGSSFCDLYSRRRSAVNQRLAGVFCPVAPR